MSEDAGYANASDDELMRRTQANDVEAFEQLYDRHGALAYRVARAVSRDQRSAEAAVQDGFLSIWRNRASYDPEGGTFKSASTSAVLHCADPTLRAAVGRLPDAQAEVIALAFYGELTHTEIARELSLPEGTVKGRMRLGLEALRHRMSA